VDEDVPVLIVGGSLVGLSTAQDDIEAAAAKEFVQSGAIVSVESLGGKELGPALAAALGRGPS
jgi:hypothetical protein